MVTFRIAETDVTAAARAHLFNSWTRPWAVAVAALVVLFAIWLALPSVIRAGDPSILTGCVVAVGVLFLVYGVSAPMSARRQFGELAGLGRPVTMTWTPARLQTIGETGSADLPWTDLWAWSRYRGGYLLYLSSRLHYIVPDRAFGPESGEALLRRALKDAGVPERRPFRRLAKRPVAV